MHICHLINHEILILHSTSKLLFTAFKSDHFNLFDFVVLCMFVDFIIHYWKINYCDTVDYHDNCMGNYCDGETATHP